VNELRQKAVQCPYCGELIDVMIDCSIPSQNYVEDCQVCCRPIVFDVTIDSEGDVAVSVSDENQ